jgi:lysylphosphatidylglycerol synthetase-like protein (DUF2156 family)
VKQLPAGPAVRGGLADRWLRRALAAPGWLLDRVEPAAEVPRGDALTPDDVVDRVRATARWPEAHLALEAGLHYHLHGDEVLAYQVRRGTAFAIGGLNTDDPTALLRSFVERARERGVRRLLVFPVRSTERQSVHAAGFGSVQVGVEAWVDLPGWSPSGKAYAHVRQMCNRARRRGVSVSAADPSVDAEQMSAIHEHWLASKEPSWRMKLLVGSPGLERPFDRRFLVARSEGRIEAFLTLLPGAAGQWGVDVMCRRPDAVAGSMEALLVHAIETLRDEGAATLSLGPCPMAGVDQGEKLLEHVFRGLYGSSTGNRLFGFRSLHRFKDKFRPRWEPVFFAAAPRLGVFSLYAGCRMWGLY